MGNPKQMDFAGLTLVAKDINLDADKPGQTGTAFSDMVEEVTAEADLTVTGDWTFPAAGITVGETALTEQNVIDLLASLN